MVSVKTNEELMVELRNRVAGRLIEFRANMLYWKKVSRSVPANTQEMVNALQAVKNNESDIQKDKLYLKCIDEMILGKDIKKR